MLRAYYDLPVELADPLKKPVDFFLPKAHVPEHEAILRHPATWQLIARDQLPIPQYQEREFYYKDMELDYWLSGLVDFLKVNERIPDACTVGKKILDFGGATGRVARHFLSQAPQSHTTLSDVNINHINWLRKHFPAQLSTYKAPAIPPLSKEDFPDNQFDLVMAFSVFTHIDQQEIPTLLELLRITKPGGYLYLTFHSDKTWALLPDIFLYQFLKEIPSFKKYQVPSTMPEDRICVSYSDTQTYNCQMFHSDKYIKDVWGKHAIIEQIIPQGHAYQSVAILHKSLV